MYHVGFMLYIEWANVFDGKAGIRFRYIAVIEIKYGQQRLAT